MSFRVGMTSSRLLPSALRIPPFDRAGVVAFVFELLVEGSEEFLHSLFLREDVLGFYPGDPGGFAFLPTCFQAAPNTSIRSWSA